jgi:hypothetical protein
MSPVEVCPVFFSSGLVLTAYIPLRTLEFEVNCINNQAYTCPGVLEDHVPIFISLRKGRGQLYLQALGFPVCRVVSAKIRTKHLQNTSLGRCCYTNSIFLNVPPCELVESLRTVEGYSFFF